MQGLVLLCTIAGPLALLSTGCTTAEPGSVNGRLLEVGATKATRLNTEDHQSSYVILSTGSQVKAGKRSFNKLPMKGLSRREQDAEFVRLKQSKIL
jgi:hypothetical protein